MARFAKVPELPLIVDERQRKGADATSNFTKKLAGPMQVCFGPACFAFSSWGTHEALEQSGLPDNCREQGWLLKNSHFLKKAEIWVIENV